MSLEQLQQRIRHLQEARQRLLDAQAVWWAAVEVARAAEATVPAPVRLELMGACWHGRKPGPEVSMMFEALAQQMTDAAWWLLCCSYGEYRTAISPTSYRTGTLGDDEGPGCPKCGKVREEFIGGIGDRPAALSYCANCNSWPGDVWS